MGSVYGVRIGKSTTDDWNDSKHRIDSEHTATYVVRADTDDADETEVERIPGVPYIGMSSPINLAARCTSRRFNEIAPYVWEVEATFSSNFSGEPEKEEPWDSRPVWSWSTEQVEEPLEFDAEGDDEDGFIAITNSALEPFQPPATVDVAMPVLTISRYELGFTPLVILGYVNKVNSASFWGAAAGHVLLSSITANLETVKEWRVWKVQYTFKFKMDYHGWKLRLLDQGSYYWDGTVGAGKKVSFGDSAMQQVIGNLDGEGGKNATAIPEFVEFNRYGSVDFNTLQLGPWGNT